MSDTDGKPKLHKHPDRDKPVTYKPYVPQYQIEGVEPQVYQGGAVVPGGVIITRANELPSDNPRARRTVRQPYAAATPSPIGRGPVPNVGNNMEHSWSSGVDGEIVDDLDQQEVDPNHPMVDNNDFVTQEALGFRNGLTAADIQPKFETFPAAVIEKEVQAIRQTTNSEDLMPIVADLDFEAYLLIVAGVPVCSGPKEEIEDQARALVFGEHEICDGNPVPVDDIVILKRVKVKVGLFLE
jgi:hypothetical protein